MSGGVTEFSELKDQLREFGPVREVSGSAWDTSGKLQFAFLQLFLIFL